MASTPQRLFDTPADTVATDDNAATGATVTNNADNQPDAEKFAYGSKLHDDLLGKVIKLRNQGARIFMSRRSDWDDVDNYTQMKLDLTAGARLGDGSRSSESYETPHARSLVIPVTFAAIYTRHTAKLSMLLSREPEVEGVSPSDIKKAQYMTAMLGYSTRKTGWPLLMNQISWDDERYGVSIMYDTFEKEHGWIYKAPLTRPGELTALTGDPRIEQGIMKEFPEIYKPALEWGETARFNRVTCIDPRRFFMDPSGSLQYLQNSRFVGHEFTRSYEYLVEHGMDNGGVYFNLDAVKEHCTSGLSSGMESQLMGSGGPANRRREFFAPGEFQGNHIVSHIQMKVIPNDKDLTLGAESKPEIWWVTWVDDTVVVRAHKNPYVHNKYTYSVGEAIPDAHSFSSPGWGEQALGIQTTVNYLINSHLANVRKTLNNSMMYSPDLVYEEDLLNPVAAGHVRFTREGTRLLKTGNMTAQNMITQLGVVDVTRSHISDAAMLSDWAQRSLGSNDPMQGMPTPGKRTLGEINTIMATASQRVGTSAKLLDAQVIRPVIERAIMNIQQLVENDQWVRLDGDLAKELIKNEMQSGKIVGSASGGIRALIAPDDLWGDFDYVPMTITSGINPQEQPDVWMKFLELMQNAPALQQPDDDGRIPDISKVYKETLRAIGIRNVDDYFKMAPPPPPAPMGAPPGMPPGPPQGMPPGGAPGMPPIKVIPDQQFQQGVKAGNLVSPGR